MNKTPADEMWKYALNRIFMGVFFSIQSLIKNYVPNVYDYDYGSAHVSFMHTICAPFNIFICIYLK